MLYLTQENSTAKRAQEIYEETLEALRSTKELTLNGLRDLSHPASDLSYFYGSGDFPPELLEPLLAECSEGAPLDPIAASELFSWIQRKLGHPGDELYNLSALYKGASYNPRQLHELYEELRGFTGRTLKLSFSPWERGLSELTRPVYRLKLLRRKGPYGAMFDVAAVKFVENDSSRSTSGDRAELALILGDRLNSRRRLMANHREIGYLHSNPISKERFLAFFELFSEGFGPEFYEQDFPLEFAPLLEPLPVTHRSEFSIAVLPHHDLSMQICRICGELSMAGIATSFAHSEAVLEFFQRLRDIFPTHYCELDSESQFFGGGTWSG